MHQQETKYFSRVERSETFCALHIKLYTHRPLHNVFIH